MSNLVSTVRDRPRTVRSVTWRWILVYVSAGAVLLEVLDVLSQRLGLPNRFFIVAAVGLALLLPGVAGAGALRGLSEEEEQGRPRRAARTGFGRGSDLERASSPASSAVAIDLSQHPPSRDDMAELHYRLGRFYEQRGDTARAAHHYEKSLDSGGDEP